MEFGEKIFFREIDLFDFTSIFGLDLLKFSGLLCIKINFSKVAFKLITLTHDMLVNGSLDFLLNL